LKNNAIEQSYVRKQLNEFRSNEMEREKGMIKAINLANLFDSAIWFDKERVLNLEYGMGTSINL